MTIVKDKDSQYYIALYKGQTWLGCNHSEALHRAMSAIITYDI